MIFCTKLYLLMSLKNVPSGFLKKFSLAPQGGGGWSKKTFLAEKWPLSLYLPNRASDFDDFCIDVRDSCPEWFGLSDLYKKILVCPPGGVLTQNPPFWLKNGLLSLYLPNRASDFDDFFTDVRYYCSQWFGISALCWKILACPPVGGIYPRKCPLLAKMP